VKNLYKKTILGNGITVISEKIESVRSIALGIWVKTGSRLEHQSEYGIAHFVEHMIFKGTRTRSPLKIAQSLERLGGSLNAFTGKEVTCYYANSLDIHLKQSVEILADIVCNSIFPDKEIVKERMVVLEEIKAVKDTPEEYIFDVFHEKLFPEDPLGHPILGYAEKIRNFNRHHVLNFWQNYYSSQNIVIAAAGNLDHTNLVKLVENYFRFNPFIQQNGYKKVTVGKPNTFYINQPINQAHICTGGKGISYTSDERFPLLVLNTYLGGGMSSKLFQTLREKHGLAYSIYSYADFYADIGLFGVYIGTDSNKLGVVNELLKNELNLARKKPMSTNRLKQIKNQLKGNLVLGLENTSRRMSRLAKNEIYFNDYISIDNLIESIDKVTNDDVLAVAENVINPDKFINVIFKPMN